MRHLTCPACGAEVPIPFPLVAVDALVEDAQGRVLLIRRLYPPPGWALPGGFVEPDETLETAVARELREETGLESMRVEQFRAYSGPGRDPRHPMVSMIFTVQARGELQAGDDAGEARYFSLDALPDEIAFDHRRILEDYAHARGM